MLHVHVFLVAPASVFCGNWAGKFEWQKAVEKAKLLRV
jgi:hypothetical protein